MLQRDRDTKTQSDGRLKMCDGVQTTAKGIATSMLLDMDISKCYRWFWKRMLKYNRGYNAMP